jgi:hypothetical protein
VLPRHLQPVRSFYRTISVAFGLNLVAQQVIIFRLAALF